MKPTLRFEVFKRDRFTCAYCGRTPPAVVLEVDHILAVAQGGSDDAENLATSCWECNRGKGARPLGALAAGTAADRAEALAEQERQLAEYQRWRATRQRRERRELLKLAEAFGSIAGNSFRQGDETRWFWADSTALIFLRKLGYHGVRELIDVTASRAYKWAGHGDRERALDTWKYFCGCCWTEIKEPRR